METGTKIEILNLVGSHACCGTIIRASGRYREFRACGSFKSQTKTKCLCDLIIVHPLENLQKYQQEISATPQNYTKDCTLGIEREKLKLKRPQQISRQNSRNI